MLDRNAARLCDRTGAEIALTPLEYRMLRVLVENRGRVLNRDQLSAMSQDRKWDPTDRSVDICVSRLRQKIERTPDSASLIVTVRGIGYLFRVAD